MQKACVISAIKANFVTSACTVLAQPNLFIMPLLRLEHILLQPEKQIGRHEHTCWELSLIITGLGQRTIGNQSSVFSQGDLVLLPPNITHCWRFSPQHTDGRGNIENISILLSPDFFKACETTFPSLVQTCQTIRNITEAMTFSQETKEEITSLILRMDHEDDAMRIPSMMQIAVIIARNVNRMECAGKQTNKEKERMERIQAYISCNFMKSITLNDIASHAGMNRSAFCRFFKEQTGQNFSTFLINRRINHACQLLRLPDTTVAEAAYKSGFNDMPYFNRLFKKIRGVSPMKFKNSNNTAP